ncbi:hypothetical protein ABE85_17950 [Mitsuaria sp. 7]|nr:hypothetical protein ABE85_17950 [Mitsuaria sp. 7]
MAVPEAAFTADEAEEEAVAEEPDEAAGRAEEALAQPVDIAAPASPSPAARPSQRRRGRSASESGCMGKSPVPPHRHGHMPRPGWGSARMVDRIGR